MKRKYPATDVLYFYFSDTELLQIFMQLFWFIHWHVLLTFPNFTTMESIIQQINSSYLLEIIL